MPSPAFAVIGSPGLADLIRSGLHRPLLTEQTDLRSVASAMRTYDATKSVPLVVVVDPDSPTAQWAETQAQRQILLVSIGGFVNSAKGNLDLGCSVHDVLSAFGMPGIPEEMSFWTIGPKGFMSDSRSTVPESDNSIPEPDWAFPTEPEMPEESAPSIPAPAIPAPATPAPAIPAPSIPAPRIPPVEDPAPEPLPTYAPAPRIEVHEPALDLGYEALVERSAAERLASNGLSPAIVVFAGGGGVGKSTIATSLAARAAAAGIRVALIDGSRGQGDLRKYLRLSGPVPSIYDAVMARDLSRAIVSPEVLNAARGPLYDPLDFSMVLAPKKGQTSPEIVTADVYAQVVLRARQSARIQLVVIDTQIAEDSDTSGLWDGVWEPMLRTDAWGVGLSDSTSVKVHNLYERLDAMKGRGLGPERIKIILDRMPTKTALNTAAVTGALSPYGDLCGMVPQDVAISEGFELGRIPHAVPVLAEPLDRVLFAVTQMQEFNPERVSYVAKSSGGLVGRLFGRKAR